MDLTCKVTICGQLLAQMCWLQTVIGKRQDGLGASSVPLTVNHKVKKLETLSYCLVFIFNLKQSGSGPFCIYPNPKA